jgi:hypothetical protein
MSVETIQSLKLKSEDLRKKLLQLMEKAASKKDNIQKQIAEVYQVEEVVKYVCAECSYDKNKTIEQWEFKTLHILNTVLLTITQTELPQKHKKGLYKAIKQWLNENKNIDNEE